jgi:hypothetical protein
MSKPFIRIAAACAIGTALLLSSLPAIALEKTATKQVDQASTDLNTDMKISAFTAAVQAAVNQLIARVNLFDGRIGTLETWRPIIQADVDSLKSRVTALESTVSYLYSSWRPWVEGQLTALTNQYNTLNTRVTTIESSPGGTIVADMANCTTFTRSSHGWSYCPNDYFMNAMEERGLATGSKIWSSGWRCCKLKIQ